jgi:dnd system-associated protein 4
MGDTRIKVAKDKTTLVKALREGEDSIGPFQSYADILVFAASLGSQKQLKKPISDYSKEIDPIRQDIFDGKGYTQTINLIAIADTNDPAILARNDEAESARIRIFEEYANAGLEILESELKGSSNYTEGLLFMLDKLAKKEDSDEDEFDLSDLIQI